MKRKIIALKKKIHGENDDEYFDKLLMVNLTQFHFLKLMKENVLKLQTIYIVKLYKVILYGILETNKQKNFVLNW